MGNVFSARMGRPITHKLSFTEELDVLSQSACFLRGALWQIQPISVSFLSGPENLCEKVRMYADEWTNDGLKFVYLASGQEREGNIRVAINVDGSGRSQSCIGTQAERIPSLEPTMTLFINEAMSETYIRYVILHEFGHAIGMVHEQCSPRSSIRLKRSVLYKRFRRQGREYVDENFLKKFNSEDCFPCSLCDRGSIMHYPFRPEETKDNSGSPLNTRLSPTDKEYAAKAYPSAVVVQDAHEPNEAELDNKPKLSGAFARVLKFVCLTEGDR